jgi:hypothetical protein
MRYKFTPGNKAAEKWSEQKAIAVLTNIRDLLWRNEITKQRDANPVRANSIKFRTEACMLGKITNRQWQHLKRKFADKTSPYFSESVTLLIETIEDTCECRLVYSGTPMDIFVLKNAYGFRDAVNPITKIERLQPSVVAPTIIILEQNKTK